MLALLLALACSEPPPPDGPILGVTRIRAFTSPDLRAWVPVPDPLPEHAMSLGLQTGGDGTLTITYMDLGGGEKSWWERTFGTPAVGVLRRTAGGWERDTWPVADDEAPAPIDPQPHGGALWYVARDGRGGDPAAGGPTRIRRLPPGETVLQGDGLTDPMPVVFRGEDLLFVTEAHRRLVLYRGDPPAPERGWSGVTVPFARVEGEALWLLGQQPAAGSRLPVPVMARSEDGRTFSAFEPLLPPGAVRVCTSPVLGRDPASGDWMLLCVEESAPPG